MKSYTDDELKQIAMNRKPDHWTTATNDAPASASTPNGDVRLPEFKADGGEVGDDLQPHIEGFDSASDPFANIPMLDPAKRVAAAPAPAGSAPSLPAAPPVPAHATPAPASPQPGVDFNGEMASAEKLLGTGQSQRTALLAALNKYRQGGQLGAGIAGIGDAIAKGGTLGKVDPHGLENVETMLNGNMDRSLQNNDVEAQRRDKAYEVAKEREGRDPNSQFSKTWIATANHVLGKYGVNLPPGMSATQAEGILGPTASLVDSQAKIAVMREEAQLRTSIEQQNASTRLKEERDNANKAVMGASAIPFVGPSHGQKIQAANELTAAGAGLHTPAGASVPTITNAAEYGALPHGAKYIDSTGKPKTKGAR